MIEDRKPRNASAETAGHRVGALANQALKLVAARNERPLRPYDPQLLGYLVEAILSPVRPSPETILARFARAGVRADEVADTYIPAAARQLGTDWEADRIGFAEVTIGSSRLQSLLRGMALDWRADCGHGDGLGAAILVLLLEGTDHTLGASLLAGRLRRRGFSVRLLTSRPSKALATAVRESRFDAVFLSASPSESVESLRRLVDCVRIAARPAPLVLGGSILQVGSDSTDLMSETGVDHATTDLDEALALCRLSPMPRYDGGPIPDA